MYNLCAFLMHFIVEPICKQKMFAKFKFGDLVQFTKFSLLQDAIDTSIRKN